MVTGTNPQAIAFNASTADDLDIVSYKRAIMQKVINIRQAL